MSTFQASQFAQQIQTRHCYDPGGTFLQEAGMCRWMGSHFHDWIDYHGVALSDFWGKTVFHIYG